MGEIITKESIKHIPFVNSVQKYYSPVIAIRDDSLIQKVLYIFFIIFQTSKK